LSGVYEADHISSLLCALPPYSLSSIRLRFLPPTNQIARAKEIKTHFLQKQAHESADARKAAERGATGAIVSLGLVEEEGGGK